MFTRRIKARGKSYIAIVDDEDAEVLRGHAWEMLFHKNGKPSAVRRSLWVDGKKPSELLHRAIMSRSRVKIASGLVVDHRNGNPLDNRRENLRVCTKQQNFQNQDKRIPKTNLPRCAVPGVAWHRVFKGWRASISIGGQKVILGLFHSMDEAIEARRKAEREHYGDFAFSSRPTPSLS
jgi:hypothetical protein